MNSSYVTDSLAVSPLVSQGGVIPHPVPKSSAHTHGTNSGVISPINSTNGSQPGVTSPNLCNIFMQGYSDCAHEALRFLIEEERLPFHHPMVVGLYEHLREQQRLFYLQYCLRGLAYNSDAETDRQAQHTSKYSGHPGLPNIQETVDEAPRKVRKVDRDSSKAGAKSIEHDSFSSEHTEVKPEMNSNSRVKAEASSGKIVATAGSDTAAEETEKLAMEIAEELFCLLQNEEFFSDDEEDEGFEDSDSIHS